MKIVIDEDIPFIQNIFEPYCEVVFLPGNRISHEDVRDADALIVRTRTNCNQQLLENSKVRFIATATIGFDHIDTDWCFKNNIQWTSAAGCNANAVVQYIICALLDLIHRAKLNPENKTLGIVGVGNVGSRLAKIAEFIGFNVLRYDPPRADKEGKKAFCSKEELFQADIISVHVPLNKEGSYPTYHWADSDFFNALKTGSIYLNSSRGEVTDEKALLQAIKSNKIGTCVLDVWENEPAINKELLSYIDTGTPHIAGYSAQGKSNATAIVVEKTADFLGLEIKYKCPLQLPSKAIQVDIKELNYWELLHYVMSSTYDIQVDNNNLRQNIIGFEKLRKEYNYRHEPLAYKLNRNNIPTEYYDLFSKIGFHLVD